MCLGLGGRSLGPSLLPLLCSPTLSTFLFHSSVPVLVPVPVWSSSSLTLFQMDLDEDAAEQLYQHLLELEQHVRATVPSAD